MNYLVLLQSYTEAKKWMRFERNSKEVDLMSKGKACVILTESESESESGTLMSAVQSVGDLPPQTNKGWIIVAHVKKPENGDENQQKKLEEKIGDKSYKIFHHGGSLNAGKTTTQGVYKKFDEAGFVEAGFSSDNLMCFSGKGNFPWDGDIDEVRKILKGENTGDALKHLKTAWNKAWAYFNINKPIEKVLEGLFPLYIDAINISPSKKDQADWNAALSSAWINLNRLFYELGSPDTNQLLKTWKEIVTQVDNKDKSLIYAVIGLLNHCIAALEITEEARTGTPDEEREKFIAMFKFLSDAYCSKPPEFSAPSS